MLTEAGLGLGDDNFEAGQRRLRLVERRLAHRHHLGAKGSDDAQHRHLGLREGAGDGGLRRAEVCAEGQHLAVHGASPAVERGNQRRLAHVCKQGGPQNGRPCLLRPATRRCQSGGSTAGNIHDEALRCERASIGRSGLRRGRYRRLRYHANTKVSKVFSLSQHVDR